MRLIKQHINYIISSSIFSVSLLAISIPLSTVQALSCINPTDMINEYVSDRGYNIALVTAGELETEGGEHDQTVIIQTIYKGTFGDTVTFIYDDTWQYLCVGSPVEESAEAIYITNEGKVIQVITPDTPLYNSLMEALADDSQLSDTITEETERTLMLQIIDLLQQVISLLQEVALSSNIGPELSVETLIGMTATKAAIFAQENNILFRVVEIDGAPQIVTEDYRPGRVNASIENNIVVGYVIEGKEVYEDTPAEVGEHDEILGQNQVEAAAYAKTKGIDFRIGRIDNEYLPLTKDYRPGRITVEIENEVVVHYSVE